MTLDEFSAALEKAAAAIPPKLFEHLNGGVNIREKAMLSPESVPEEPRYILGQYHHQRTLGRWIDLYYGSFCRVYACADEKTWSQAIDRVLRHELRHHMEDQAGERALIDEDKREMRAYRLRHQTEEDTQ